MIKYQLGRFSKYSTRPQNFEARIFKDQRTVYCRVPGAGFSSITVKLLSQTPGQASKSLSHLTHFNSLLWSLFIIWMCLLRLSNEIFVEIIYDLSCKTRVWVLRYAGVPRIVYFASRTNGIMTAPFVLELCIKKENVFGPTLPLGTILSLVWFCLDSCASLTARPTSPSNGPTYTNHARPRADMKYETGYPQLRLNNDIGRNTWYSMKVLLLFVLYLLIIDLVMTSGSWWTATEIENKHEKPKQLKRRGRYLTLSNRHLCQR